MLSFSLDDLNRAPTVCSVSIPLVGMNLGTFLIEEG
jgi:hypothetical protein